MRTDVIEAVGVEDDGSLWVKPAAATFPYIYREAMEIHWDAERLRLYTPKPRQWSHVDWFKQIRNAARLQGVRLTLEQTTSWLNVDADLQQAIMKAHE
jgi:hypothetical protein